VFLRTESVRVCVIGVGASSYGWLLVQQGPDGHIRSSAHSLHPLYSVLAVLQSLFFTLIIVSDFVLFLSSCE
jgi:hypothetical protein